MSPLVFDDGHYAVWREGEIECLLVRDAGVSLNVVGAVATVFERGVLYRVPTKGFADAAALDLERFRVGATPPHVGRELGQLVL